MTSSSRTLLRLAGAPNFRDLGGYRTLDGQRVRTGLVYRSEGLSELTDDDLEVIRGLSIRLICDIRSDQERQFSPSRWPDTQVETLHLGVVADLRASFALMNKILRDDPTSEGATAAMLLSYREFPDAFASHLTNFFRRIVDGRSLPLVFHCSAGKDRTGFVAAMLLAALGVDEESILADYLLTTEYWQGPRSESSLKRALYSTFGEQPPPEVLAPLAAAHKEYLLASFETIHERYASISRYLEQAAGLTANMRQELRKRLLE